MIASCEGRTRGVCACQLGVVKDACYLVLGREGQWADAPQRGTATLREWNRLDPGVEEFARKGYALFPGSKGWAGPRRRLRPGVVYEQGQHIGYADLTQGTFGLQAGGRTTVS
jgi:hypothetical protein